MKRFLLALSLILATQLSHADWLLNLWTPVVTPLSQTATYALTNLVSVFTDVAASTQRGAKSLTISPILPATNTATVTIQHITGTTTNTIAVLSPSVTNAVWTNFVWIGSSDSILLTKTAACTNLPTVSLSYIPSPFVTNLLNLSDTEQVRLIDIRHQTPPLPNSPTNTLVFSTLIDTLWTNTIHTISNTTVTTYSPTNAPYLVQTDKLTCTITRITNSVPMRILFERQRIR